MSAPPPVYGGFEGQFKKLHRTAWYPVEINGVAQVFDTRDQAEVAAYRALMKHLFGDGILRDGEKASAAAAEAEFRKIFPGKGKVVEVVRR